MTERHGSSERIARKRVPVIQRHFAEVGSEESLVDASRGHGRGHGQVSARQAFADTHEVGTDSALFGGEQRASSSESSGNFIGNEQDVVFATCVTNALDGLGVGNPHARSALHEWLDNNGREFMCMGGDHRNGGVGPAEIVIARSAQNIETQRIEHVCSESTGADRDSPDGVAVVGPAESEIPSSGGDALIRPVLKRDFDCLLNRSCAIGGKEKMWFADGHTWSEGLC